jgi:aromatic ring-opening dioxygenase catalytic subunit (LigB family)
VKASAQRQSRLPTYFISHGGGPWPYMEDLRRQLHVLEASLDIPRQLESAPEALLVISGHWDEADFVVMAAPKPPMVYDYSGFPEHTDMRFAPWCAVRTRRESCLAKSKSWSEI